VLRISLLFLLSGIACLFLSDLEIISLDPRSEFIRMRDGLLSPAFNVILEFYPAIINTLSIALLSTGLSLLTGLLLAFYFNSRWVRVFSSFIRSIHELFWVFLLLPVAGLNTITGIAAIAIPYSGIFAKVFAEIIEEADKEPARTLPVNSSQLSRFLYGTVPLILKGFTQYASYRFECAIRSSAVVGFIGIPTIGFHLETAFREGIYDEATALLICFYLIIATMRWWLRAKLVPVYLILATAFLPLQNNFSLTNLTRFFTNDILPWPIRRSGVLDGSGTLEFSFLDIWQWFQTIFMQEILPGIFNTVVLTQVALVGTGIFVLLLLPFLSKNLTNRYIVEGSSMVAVILRSTPEYILAYMFLQLWGPSMLPAIIAIILHNGGIITWLSGKDADRISLRLDKPKAMLTRYGYEILPRIYGQFLAFLFYRWEIMMRESAILGILGIYTLGFFVDSAIADSRMDKALILILATGILNMVIDAASRRIRKRLHLSNKINDA